MVPFQTKYPFAHRRQEYEKIMRAFPGRIPLIVQHSPKDRSGIPDLDKYKFLTPSDLTLGQFKMVVHKHLPKGQNEKEALFLFIGQTLCPCSSLMGELYKQHADKDGFLYIEYAGMETFGSL